ncbi:CDP-alcohol phosphatidyltransferase family protein [Ramlibacter sp.]|uniref:CDP-alcohol phosphatidyltransferase family protein n=1 Tax=Ramlibacter sp. TaxID=1917967 RepID=UPI0026231E6F|nr:CDP-alcohol phosphatidyltransferase family protein [Ramlibacter sp.]MDB5957081.1 CDP-diacylglycerol--serine O-phosphatidyltransferase [Ramlibacter sp.]
MILDYLIPSRRRRSFEYVKRTDAWSTVLVFDFFAVAMVELVRRLPRARLSPDHFTAFSIVFFFFGVSWLYAGNTGVAMGGFFLSILMDCVDGKLARAINWRTKHGAVADALADCVVHGIGYPLIALYSVQQVGWNFAAVFVLAFSLYLVWIHIDAINTHIGRTGEQPRVMGEPRTPFARFGLAANPWDIIDMAFVFVPFVFLATMGHPVIANSLIALFFLLQFLKPLVKTAMWRRLS